MTIRSINTSGLPQGVLTPMGDLLFAASEPGAWYDPSDMSTLFQDSAGTVPVTAVEQPVGVILDKSKRLVLGPELVTNGDFSNGTTGWSAYNAVISAVNGTLKVDDSSNLGANSSAVQQLNLVAGRTYLFTFDVVSVSGAWSIGFATTGSSAGITYPSAMLSKTTTGPQRFVFTYDGTRNFLFMVVDGSGIVFYDNISVKELPGNHATQATTTKRPVLSRRVNLLTKTEQFDDAVWVKDAGFVTPAAYTSPTGQVFQKYTPDATNVTNHRVRQAVALPAGVSYTLSFDVKAAGYTGIKLRATGAWVNFNLTTGAVGNSANVSSPTITALDDGIYRVSATFSIGASNAYIYVDPSDTVSADTAAFAGDGTSGIYFRGASLTLAIDNHLPYQWVNTATDYDADPNKFPAYLRFDGVDDALATGNIDFTGTDKMTVWAGVTRLSDTPSQIIAELSSIAESQPGSWELAAQYVTYNYFATSLGLYANGRAVVAFAVPTVSKDFITLQMDLSAPTPAGRLSARRNTSGSANTGVFGYGGNYGNYPLYIGARNNTSLFFSGRIYSLIVRGAESSLSQIEATENLIRQKMRLP